MIWSHIAGGCCPIITVESWRISHPNVSPPNHQALFRAYSPPLRAYKTLVLGWCVFARWIPWPHLSQLISQNWMENLPETSVSFYVLLHLMVTTCKNHGFLQSFPQTNPLIVTSSHCAGSNLHASNAHCWHSFSACSGGSCWLIWSDCDEDSSD